MNPRHIIAALAVGVLGSSLLASAFVVAARLVLVLS